MALTAEYLDVAGAEIPAEKFYTFGGVQYIFRVKKNDIASFFTIEIYDTNNETFVYSNKIVYGSNLTDSILCPFQDKIIPLNIQVLAGQNGTVVKRDGKSRGRGSFGKSTSQAL